MQMTSQQASNPSLRQHLSSANTTRVPNRAVQDYLLDARSDVLPFLERVTNYIVSDWQPTAIEDKTHNGRS